MKPGFLLLPALILFALAIEVSAQSPKKALVSFRRQVMPVMEKHCTYCHGAGESGGLNLKTKEGFLKGGKNGALFVKGKSAASLLYQRIEANDPKHRNRMPKRAKPLADADILTIKSWIDQGAKFD